MAYTLVHGAVSDWYPYPFVNVTELGCGRVLLNCLGITALFLGCGALALIADRRLPSAPATK